MITSRIIGAISHNVDGQDLYLLLEEGEGCITDYAIEEFFREHYYAQTTQEAGGYFCYRYKWLPMDSGLSCGVLIVYQQYDV
jgi:hypothetical protein